MKARLFVLTLFFISAIIAATPVFAGDLYNNGPVNGETDAWTINFGFVVSDTFTVSTGTSQVTGMSFWAWLFPGDVLESAEVSITSMEQGGTTYFDQVVNFSQAGCFGNQYGYNVCQEAGSFNAGLFNNGTYWVNLGNAVVNTGDPVYWDENAGVGCTSPGCPSEPSQNGEGTILSESFTMLGNTQSTTTTGTVPEPGSLMLFATGALGIASLLRRKLG